MKLQKWKRGTCGFEWFEPLSASKKAAISTMDAHKDAMTQDKLLGKQ